MSKINIKVVAFDVFGTLVKIGTRRSPYKKLMKWLRDDGRKPEFSDAATIMSINGGFEEIVAHFGKQIPSQLLLELNTDLKFELQRINLYEDTIFTLQKLSASRFKLALCSNCALPYGKIAYSLLPQFDVYAWSYEVGTVKPDPKIYQYFMEQLNCQADEVLFIGDTYYADVEGPLSCGMHAKLINRKDGQNLNDVLTDLL